MLIQLDSEIKFLDLIIHTFYFILNITYIKVAS